MSDARAEAAHFELSHDRLRLRLAGAWRLAALPALSAALDEVRPQAPLTVDGESLTALDSAGALALVHAIDTAGVPAAAIDWRGFAPPFRRILDDVLRRRAELAEMPPHWRRRWLAQIGMHAMVIYRQGVDHLNFLGEATSAFLGIAVAPRRLRLRELTAQLEQSCLNAIPVVVLVTLLIGVVFAYLLGLQAEKYGANIFVVDGVGIGMAREFAPIIVAVIIAGRSGAAFTAQLGSMRLTEEIDAIRTLGLSAMQVLVVPRVLGLVIALPLLTVLADAMGLAGGALLSWSLVDITFTQYVERVNESISDTTFWVGVVKAPVFAFAIALVGTMRGMQVRGSSRELGRLTTVAVVQSIFLVILFDALFAVVFMELDI